MAITTTERIVDALDILELEKEIASVETDAVKEEENNASSTYAILDKQLSEIISQIPYPRTEKYTTANDYDAISKIQWEKDMNSPYWEKRDEQRAYCENGHLYCGHLSIDGDEYYIMDSRLETRMLEEGSSIMLVNADDKNYAFVVRAWRYPDQNKKVELSRNISMQNRIVESVEVVLDKSNAMFSKITDAYLRKALIRNRISSNGELGNNMKSIIQTIQKKQDDIRSLNVGDAFIVQGCAGSGKTMVLLHRLRYLLFNQELDIDEYVFLIPSIRFKKFIKNISVEFRISENNIFSFMSYYQTLCGKDKEITDDETDELVFDGDFLAKVYSRDFFIEAYGKLFEELQRQVEGVIEYGEERLNALMNREQKSASKEINAVERDTIDKINEIIHCLSEQLSHSVENMESISLVIDEIKNIYKKNKSIIETLTNADRIQIDPEDERILSNDKLNNLKAEIESEESAVMKANVFTVRAHQNKLAKLKEQYEEEYKDVEQILIEEEKKIIALKAADMKYIFEDVTLEDLKNIIDDITLLYEDAVSRIDDARIRRDNINDFIALKYGEEINVLNELIDISPLIREESAKYIYSLTPAYDYIVSIMKLGMILVRTFKGKSKEDEKDREKIKLFGERTDVQAQAYLNTLLLNNCKKSIKEEFEIAICDLYKHYWFIKLYCQYLTRPQSTQKYGFIYIDEGQDLSKVEIELIHKINSNFCSTGEEQIKCPIMNIFGDVNQTVTKHGIHSWNEIDFINSIYLLDENFRNSNQIIEYCNEVLPFKMKKIGVNMEPVERFESILDALKVVKQKKNEIYIVKDEYAKKDLQIELEALGIVDGTIYTVKDVKGLEFRETIVFDRNMTDNERYIAYTRALVKLTIVQELVSHTDKDEKLYIQGEDYETELDD